MKLLVTGASGFIGTNLIINSHKSYDITALVRTQSNTDAIAPYCKTYRYDGDIKELVDFCTEERFDGVVHLATLYRSSHDLEELNAMLGSNILLGTQLLEALKNTPPKFFINTLTFSQFANSPTYSPGSLYDATKEAFYAILQFYALEMPTLFSHLLLYNTYGPNDNRPKIFNLWRKIAQTQEVLEMSKGEQLIDISHINDVIAGFNRLIEMCEYKEVVKDQIYTLENTRYPLRELAELYEKYTHSHLNIKWGARPYRNREILDPISSKHNKALLKLPRWTPKISLQEGLKDF